MDPNAALDLMMAALIAALVAGDTETAREHADNLHTWLASGGFAPDRPNARSIIADVMRTA